MAEAFVKTFNRGYVYLNDLPDAATVMARLPEWIEDYNRIHPVRAFKYGSEDQSLPPRSQSEHSDLGITMF